MTLFVQLFVVLPLLVMAVVLHEVAHGYVAYRLGDPTARQLGRLSLNPLVHVDLWLTVIIPLGLILAGSPVIFGGAKPVPVNPLFFQNPRRGMVWVAIAGPLTNFALAAIFLGALMGVNLLIGESSSLAFLWVIASFVLGFGVLINVVLAVFNLFPVPPLDGGRIAVGLLPLRLARPLARLEPYGILIVILLLFAGVFERFLGPVLNFIGQYIPQ